MGVVEHRPLGDGGTSRHPHVAVELTALVFDLDGVIRHYDHGHTRNIEDRHGLVAGSLMHAAFGGELGRSFVCGELDHDQFADALGGAIGSTIAAAEFVEMRAEVDPEAVELIRRLRRRLPVALLTNGSVRTRTELAEAGLADSFDHVFNSAETGVPKPSAAAFLNVVRAFGALPEAVAFVDDHEPNVEGAINAGLVGHHYRGLDELRRFLGEWGLHA